tara:strand:+ start:231 stop:1265 length:1035 start_codon:yes stop_codon:yes gene_type:complete
MVHKFFALLKIILFNFFFFFLIILVVEIIFGSWFKNNFNLRLSSERNIDRVYKFNFDYHKGQSRYLRDNFGFRVKSDNTKPEDVYVVFAGGSTVNQKFLNYDETIVGILQKKFKNIKIVNSGIDGMSIIGHINSFDLWYNKIDKFNPEYYIFFIGINDRYLLSSDQDRAVDQLIEPSLKGRIREYLESNSLIYKLFRKSKSTLYLRFGIQKGANHVNKKTFVYSERTTKDFIKYNDFSNNEIIINNEQSIYENYLNQLTNKVRQNNSKIIYITQISGHGMNKGHFIIAETIMKHCKKNKITCINLAKNANLEYDDFYDSAHTNRKGTKKISEFIYKELSKIFLN